MRMAYDEAHEAARALAQARWGNRGLIRAAETVIDRAAELPETMRAAVHLATADSEDDSDGV